MERDVMALRITIEGNRENVKDFVSAIRSMSQWCLFSGAKMAINREEIQEEYFVKQKSDGFSQDVSRVSIKSCDQQQIDIDLLHAEVIEMGNGVTYVHGKHFDIFAG